MSLFIWHSKGSKESGEVLSRLLDNAAAGTLPPKDFSGLIISVGAKPSDKFKWEGGGRNIRAVLNDPRKTAAVYDRKKMFDAIRAGNTASIAGLPVSVINNQSNYAGISSLLGPVFTACKSSGAAARLVHSQAEFAEALVSGCTLAIDHRFLSQTRCRVFVFKGTVLGALQRNLEGSTDTETFIHRATADLNNSIAADAAEAIGPVLRALLERGIVKAAKSYWAPYSLTSTRKRNAAVLAASLLGYDFCAVDMALGEAPLVFNVVSTPDLSEASGLHGNIAKAFKRWVTENSKTARQILQELANNASEEEATAVLEELRGIKARAEQEENAANA